MDHAESCILTLCRHNINSPPRIAQPAQTQYGNHMFSTRKCAWDLKKGKSAIPANQPIVAPEKNKIAQKLHSLPGSKVYAG